MNSIKISTCLLMLVLMSSLCSCTAATKSRIGAGGGAAAGALLGQMIGKNTESTLIGAAVGTMLGYMVGNEMEKYDKIQLNKVYDKSPTGKVSTWTNPDNGNSYSVTPQKTTYNSDHQPCRKAYITAIIDGKVEKTEAEACRNENGNWTI